jgi:RNA polymerase sigma-70 factor (ECF subfamily)
MRIAMDQSLLISGQSLDRYRNYLRLLARAEIAPCIRRRVEPSDIVQETLAEAFQKREQFRGQTDGEIAQWLRQMLLHNVLDATRALRRQKRDVARERRLDSIAHDSSARVGECLMADQSSPSEHLAKIEQVLRIAEAVSQLPPDQQDAVVLHHLHGKSLAELAELLDRSQTAVAGLLYRGLKRLRGLLSETDI